MTEWLWNFGKMFTVYHSALIVDNISVLSFQFLVLFNFSTSFISAMEVSILSPEGAILLVCARNRDLRPPPKPEDRASRTHCHIWQIWLAEKHRTSTLRMLRNWERGLDSWRRPEGARPLGTRMWKCRLKKTCNENILGRVFVRSRNLICLLIALLASNSICTGEIKATPPPPPPPPPTS